MLHGMRDVALSLLPIAERLSRNYRILLPDLRGHGRSDRPGNYALPQYLFDLHCLFDTLLNTPAALFGHSLGGQIASRFCALFPDRVRAAVIVEGLGPPARALPPADALQAEADRLLRTLGDSRPFQTTADVAFAAERLLANNPRLAPDLALTLARQATELDSEGQPDVGLRSPRSVRVSRRWVW